MNGWVHIGHIDDVLGAVSPVTTAELAEYTAAILRGTGQYRSVSSFHDVIRATRGGESPESLTLRVTSHALDPAVTVDDLVAARGARGSAEGADGAGPLFRAAGRVAGDLAGSGIVAGASYWATGDTASIKVCPNLGSSHYRIEVERAVVLP